MRTGSSSLGFSGKPRWISVRSSFRPAFSKSSWNLSSVLSSHCQLQHYKQEEACLCLPRDAAVLLVVQVARAGAQVLLDDDEPRLRHQRGLAPLEVPQQLVVVDVVEAPLRPDEVVLDIGRRRPVLEADVEDVAHAFNILQIFGELGHGLEHVDGLSDGQEQFFCDSADATTLCR